MTSTLIKPVKKTYAQILTDLRHKRDAAPPKHRAAALQAIADGKVGRDLDKDLGIKTRDRTFDEPERS